MSIKSIAKPKRSWYEEALIKERGQEAAEKILKGLKHSTYFSDVELKNIKDYKVQGNNKYGRSHYRPY